MTYDHIVMSSGHGKYVRGASGILDEVDEARRVVDEVAAKLSGLAVNVKTYHDDVSKTQNENLNRIVDFHNAQMRDLDISVHFNAHVETTKPMGVEVLYQTQNTLAAEMSLAIADVGFVNRGPKRRTDLFFLNNTSEPAILIEVCFVDSSADAEVYKAEFDEVCEAIAGVVSGGKLEPIPPAFAVTGPASWFGGPADEGVAADEGLALVTRVEQAPHLFLPSQPSGTTGLARRLNPYVPYVACRWNYAVTPKEMLISEVAEVIAVNSGVRMKAFPADWGPNENTGRAADLSPGLLDALGLATDDVVEVIFPYREE